MRAVFDTNILIDYLKGIEAARTELALYESPQMSIITWMELLVGARDDAEKARLRRFARRFELCPLSAEVAEIAVEVRKQHRIRLPDAVIWATARAQGAILVTRNVRDFPSDHPGIRVPYRI